MAARHVWLGAGRSTGIGLAVAVVLSGGCATGRFAALGPGTLTEGSPVLGVPVVQQEAERTCGGCALAMLSRYHGVAVRAEDMARVRQQAAGEKGVSGRILKDVFERNGFDAYVFRGELSDAATPAGLAYHLQRGRPVMVMLSAGRGRNHYVVVTGLDETKDLVVIADPEKGNVVCRGDVFRHLWERSGFFALLAVPAGDALAARPLDDGERASLDELSSRTPELADQSGGYLTNDDLVTILLIILIVLLLPI